MSTRMIALGVAILAGLIAEKSQAHENDVEIIRKGDQVCIKSNGAPDHEMGQFPTRGNPNSFSLQNLEYCFDGSPRLTGRTNSRVQVSGVTLKGIPIRPGTADFYDPDSRRGFSRDPSSGWRLEGMGAADMLGMDQNNAHVDNRGLYHYHGVSGGLLDGAVGTLIAYAADGFEIHYVGKEERSSWQLKSGKRATPPNGSHDGTYVEDWEYVAGSGSLDECNGKMVDGTYTYFATDTYPFFPRCFKGEVSADFQSGPQGGARPNRPRPGNGMRPPRPNRG